MSLGEMIQDERKATLEMLKLEDTALEETSASVSIQVCGRVVPFDWHPNISIGSSNGESLKGHLLHSESAKGP